MRRTSGGATILRRPAGFSAVGRRWSADSTSTSRSCWFHFSSSDRNPIPEGTALCFEMDNMVAVHCLAPPKGHPNPPFCCPFRSRSSAWRPVSIFICLPRFLPGVENVWADALSRFRGSSVGGSFAGALCGSLSAVGHSGGGPLRVPPPLPNYRPF
ncbi:hypothetical protein GWK47_014912 [Chionoecetes opilio]|uniref:Uncharacterized protein n=1 Tax=Chionoecetes opilio TaxID=41210 RepID=A0A8J4XSU7_CHIOP|nr:hypothetical protein GWK47_014912 [Chionoecetes opilio]